MGFTEELGIYEEMKANLIVLERKLEDKRKELVLQKENFTKLCQRMEKEKKDFDKLKKTSFSQLLAKIAGNYDEKCDKEYREYIEAKRYYDEAQYQVEESQREVYRLEEEIRSLQKSIPEKIKELRESFEEGKAFGEQLDKEKEALLCQKREIFEALEAVRKTKRLAKDALSSLESADFSATWDMLGKGSLLADMAKYSALEKAQNTIMAMKAAAASMQKELADVDITFREEIDMIDNGTKFFDIFFDDIFTAWGVKGRIGENKAKMQNYLNHLEEVEDKLQKQNADVEKKLEEYQF